MLCLAAFALPAAAQTTVPIYAAEDTFVMLPGLGNTANYWDGADRNFGGMRSRHVAAATARPDNDPAIPAKGEFQAVARFYPSNAVAQFDTKYGVGRWYVSGLALKLVTSDNVAGSGLFNAPGNAGQYLVGWMPEDGGWTQGNGYINQGLAPHDPAASPDNFTNLTFNGLQDILATHPAVVLNTLDFVKQGILAPVTNALPLTNSAFLAALAGARPVSLLFAAADDQVAFNFTSHLYDDDRGIHANAPQIILTAAPLPGPAARLETVAGRPYLQVDFLRQTGISNLTCVVEITTNLTEPNWTVLASGTNGLALAGPGLVAETNATTAGLADVTVRDVMPVSAATSRFVRLRFYK